MTPEDIVEVYLEFQKWLSDEKEVTIEEVKNLDRSQIVALVAEYRKLNKNP